MQVSNDKLTVGVVVPATGFNPPDSFKSPSLRFETLQPPINVACIMSHSQIFVEGTYTPYICACEFSTKHLLIHVPVMSLGHKDAVEVLKSARNFRVLIQSRVDGVLAPVIDETLTNFRFDRINYSVKIHSDSSCWIAELRFVAPLVAVDGDAEKAAS